MSKGTNRTPPRITLRFDRFGQENKESAVQQLHKLGVPPGDILRFSLTVDLNRTAESGQIDPLNKAAEEIGAEIRWV